MPSVTLSQEMMDILEKAHYLLGYLAKLHDENAVDGSHSVPVTIRSDGQSSFVIDIDGHSIEFGAGSSAQNARPAAEAAQEATEA